MTEGSIATSTPRDTDEADAAMARLHDRGFTAFRNGRIAVPAGHAVTDDDRSDFTIVRNPHHHSKLVRDRCGRTKTSRRTTMQTATAMTASAIADQLVDGRSYSVRTYRSHQGENPPPFVPTALFVQHHKGRAVTITPRDYDWADMDPRQECSIDGPLLRCMAEDYCMDIEIASITA